MAIPIEIAAIRALAEHLATELPDVEVYDDWAEPDVELPPKAISIVPVGARQSLSVILDGTPRESRELTPPVATQLEYRYDLDFCTQRVQLDVWATNRVNLYDIKARLDVALRKGPSSARPVRDGLLLELDEDSGHEGHVDVQLADGPDDLTSADSVQRGEWRATVFLELGMHLRVWATTYRQAQIVLQSRIGSGSLGSPAEEETTVTA